MKSIKNCRSLNYFEYFIILVSVVSGWVLISAFPSLVSAPVDISRSEVGLKICVLIAGIKKYKLIIKKKTKKHDNIAFLPKTKFYQRFDF